MKKEEFLELTKSVWTFGVESARRVGHPAPFPVELPLRCVKFYTFENDVVFDPFMGSGTTAIACLIAIHINFGTLYSELLCCKSL